MFGVWYQLLSGCVIARPFASVSNGTEVSMSPMSSTRNTTILGRSCAAAYAQPLPDMTVNISFLLKDLICMLLCL